MAMNNGVPWLLSERFGIVWKSLENNVRTVPIEYQYKISYKRYREAKTTTVAGRDFTDLLLRDVPEEQMHLVARIRNDQKKWRFSTGAERFVWAENQPDGRLMAFEGALWLEWGSFENLAEDLRREKDASTSPFAGIRSKMGLTDKYSTLEEEIAKNPRCREPVDTRNEVFEALHKRAAGIVVVDGIVFERVFEPRLIVRDSFDGGISIGIGGFDGDPNVQDWTDWIEENKYDLKTAGQLPWYCMGDRLNRLGDLKERLNIHFGTDVKVECRVDIVDPSFLQVSVMRDMAAAGVRGILQEALAYASTMSSEMLDCYLDLRDAVQAAGDGVTKAVKQAITRIAELDETRMDEEELRFFRLSQRTASNISSMIQRCSQRARDIVIGLDREHPGYNRDEEMDDEALIDMGDGVLAQEVRSPEPIRNLAVSIEMPSDILNDYISRGGRVYEVSIFDEITSKSRQACIVVQDGSVVYQGDIEGEKFSDLELEAVSERLLQRSNAVGAFAP